MDDINFEELDKAVNSALKQTEPKPISAPEASDVPVLKTDAQEAAPQQPVAPRRRGQFMDMIHPSSDMIKQQPAVSRPSRQAPTLQPLNPSIVETAPKEVAPEAAADVHIQDDALAAESTKQARAEWPDPLDVMEQTEQEREEAPVGGSETAVLDTDSKENEPIDDDPQEQPATSPFINGADFEKRPLGAFADSNQDAPVTDPVDTADKQPDDKELMASDAEIDEIPHEFSDGVPTPQELTPEVVSVESDDPAQMNDESVEVETGPDADAIPSPHDPSGVATSISQQYRNPDVSAEEEDGHPVFDTKDYHQPLTPPVKKSHTVAVTALVIITLAVLGAGAWYAIAVLKLI